MENDIIVKLFELQKLVSRKADLALRVASIRAHELRDHLELDLRRSIHSVGGARARFNEAGKIEYMSDQRERDRPVLDEYHEVCQQVDELIAEIDALIPTGTF